MESHVNAIITAIPPTLAVIVGVVALRKGQKTMMVNIDGRMEQLLAVTKTAAISEGKETERVEARDRREEIKVEIAKTTKPKDDVQDVNVVNPPEEPVNTEVINPPSKPVHTLEQRQDRIDRDQKKLDQDVDKGGSV